MIQIVLRFVLGIILLAGWSQAQESREQPAAAMEGPVVFYDYACFKNIDDSSRTKLELYFSVFQNSLTFQNISEAEWRSDFRLNIKLLRGDSIAVSDSSDHVVTAEKEPQQQGKTTLLTESFWLAPGEYDLTIEIRDLAAGVRTSRSSLIDIPDFSENHLQLSGIELAEEIKETGASNAFTKYGKQVLPNPSKMYNVRRPFMFYYFEIYSLLFTETPDGMKKYSVAAHIEDGKDQVLVSGKEKIRIKVGSSSVIFDRIRISSLNTLPEMDSIKKLTLVIKVKDYDSEQTAVAEKEFYYIPRDANEPIATGQTISDERLEEIYEELKPIAVSGELDIFDELNSGGKMNLIRDFWKKRDPTPETPENEYMIDYYNKLQYVKESFAEGSRSGIKTDRGRIYLKYGPPTQIIRHDNDIGMKPYIEWIYYMDSRRIFIFANLEGFGKYRLIHSTWHGELSDDDWQKRIMIKPGEMY
ncbi:GWxTD domain-containing protein [candidate division KSB1 bacterium]|nr:GWxTD domain-containing protein [candidate division KSB1 bacterium]